MKPKIVRITTVPISMNIILKGQLGFMNHYFDIVGATSYDEKLFKEIESREGIRMYPIELARTISPWKDMKALIAMIIFFYKERPDIVHTHTPKAGLIGMLAAWLTRVPVRMHTIGGIPWMEISGFRRSMLKTIEILTYFCAQFIYPNSRGLKEFIISEHLCSEKKVKFLANGGSNGINTTYFSPTYMENAIERRAISRSNLDIYDGDIVIGFVGRIAKEKGIAELLDAFDILRKDYPIKIVFVGLFERVYGGLSKEVEEKINADEDIHFLGRFDDVRPYYAMMDIFVFPSYREGFPNAVLEACAMGLPVIASNINGCNEIIIDGENGLLIPVKSAQSIKDSIENLVKNPDLRKRMGAKARQIVELKFQRELVWQAIKNEYDNLLSEIK